MSVNVKLIYEFVGTAIFVLSILLSSNALVIGGTLAALIWISQQHSWAHYNPAVSLAMSLRGSIPWSVLPIEIGAQLAGAGVGYSIYQAIKSI